jgi:hypothetical protein
MRLLIGIAIGVPIGVVLMLFVAKVAEVIAFRRFWGP